MQNTNTTEKLGRGAAAAEQSTTPQPDAKWAALINDTLVPAPQRQVRASVLLAQAGATHGHVLVRDHGGDEDVTIAPDEPIDLAAGNVFNIVSACDAPPKTEGAGAAKL